MARWKLTEKNYLKVPGTKWELTIADRVTGRPVRKVFDVPRYLDPDDQGDWTHHEAPGVGYIAVCHEGTGEARDIIFIGDPTPGMLPLDDEAKAITAKFTWTPTRSTADEDKENSFSQKLLMGLVDQMADVQAKAASAPMGAGMEKLFEAMSAMMAQNAQLLAALGAKAIDAEHQKQARALGEEPQQVIDEEEPLEHLEPTAEEIAEAAEAAQALEAESNLRAAAVVAAGEVPRASFKRRT
jgi:hypothetical protein